MRILVGNFQNKLYRVSRISRQARSARLPVVTKQDSSAPAGPGVDSHEENGLGRLNARIFLNRIPTVEPEIPRMFLRVKDGNAISVATQIHIDGEEGSCARSQGLFQTGAVGLGSQGKGRMRQYKDKRQKSGDKTSAGGIHRIIGRVWLKTGRNSIK